jgi:hypothetical protein
VNQLLTMIDGADATMGGPGPTDDSGGDGSDPSGEETEGGSNQVGIYF